jgi:hypothetical protein
MLFFDQLENLNNKYQYSPSLIGNFDETMLQFLTRKIKVLVPKDCKEAIIPKQPEGPHITLGVTIFADGSHSDTLVILPLKTLPQSLETLHSGYCFSRQDSGWINTQIFEDYCRKIIIPAYISRMEKISSTDSTIRGLLILDSHTSRINASLLQEFAKNRIDILTLVSHSTHVLQPLDRGVFREFKNCMKRKRVSLDFKDTDMLRFELLKLAKQALHNALYEDIVKRAFKETGIYPIDRKLILNHPAVGESPFEKKRVRDHSNIKISNRVVTQEDTILEIQKAQKEKLAKKKKR